MMYVTGLAKLLPYSGEVGTASLQISISLIPEGLEG